MSNKKAILKDRLFNCAAEYVSYTHTPLMYTPHARLRGVLLLLPAGLDSLKLRQQMGGVEIFSHLLKT